MVKALYRRAQAHLALAHLEECEADLRRALLYDSGNKDVRALFKQYKAKVRRQKCGPLHAVLVHRASSAVQQGWTCLRRAQDSADNKHDRGALACIQVRILYLRWPQGQALLFTRLNGRRQYQYIIFWSWLAV